MRSHFIVVRELESGYTVAVGRAMRGKLVYSNAGQIRLADIESAYWLERLAKETMPRLQGQRQSFKVVEVKEDG